MKKLIFLLTLLVGIFAFDAPQGIAPVSGKMKSKNAVVTVKNQYGDSRSLEDQKDELSALLELNRYAIVITALYALFLGAVLIAASYKSSLWLEITQFGSNIRARIKRVVHLSIAKTIKHIHIYRALTSFFLV